jgi:hypothetical protein
LVYLFLVVGSVYGTNYDFRQYVPPPSNKNSGYATEGGKMYYQKSCIIDYFYTLQTLEKINVFVMCTMFRTDSYVIQRCHGHRIIGSESNRTRCQIITAAHETSSSNENDTHVTWNFAICSLDLTCARFVISAERNPP